MARGSLIACIGIGVLLAMGIPAAADGAIPPDTGLEERQALALPHVAASLRPLRDYDYHGNRSDCVAMGSDGYGLVAQLELDRRGLEGGISPADAAPLARHIAENVTRLVGTLGAEGRCAWGQAGAPAPLTATVALAYAMHRFGTEWPVDVKEAIRAAAEDLTWDVYPCLHNASIEMPCARMLAGEALGRPALFDQGLLELEIAAEATITNGLCEPNAPLYSAHHVPPLVFAQALADPIARDLARIMLEHELLFEGHSYLPGGAMGAPQMRDYAGGAQFEGLDYMPVVLWLLVGDEAVSTPESKFHFTAAAASEYVLPEIIRSIFLDKAEGYSSWTYTFAQQGTGRTPEAVYDLGLDGARAIPWQTVMLPGGIGSLGVSYGYRRTDLYVSSGVYVRDPAGLFALLYQYQPSVCGDTDDTGGVFGCGGSSVNEDPDDFAGELYDYERMVYGRTAISLWDPTARPGVVRTHQDTRVHLPKLDVLGGEATRVDDWFVYRLGDAYLAYRPLGPVALEEDRGDYVYLRLDGRSGGITELATTSTFPDLASYAASIASRHVAFDTDPLVAEVDAWDPQTSGTVRIRLEYRPERRFVAGAELSIEEALGHGLMKSPWVSWDPATRVLRVARDCYPSRIYDWANKTITEQQPPPECAGGAGGAAGGPSGGAGSGATGTGGAPSGGASPHAASDEQGGCGCVSVGRHGSGLHAAAVLLAVAIARARRRPIAPRAPRPVAH